MSNYYYEEKIGYLDSLSAVRAENHDLTKFAVFALRGVATQCGRLLRDIKTGIQKTMFRNTMFDLFEGLESPRKRVIAIRQLAVLKLLLKSSHGSMTLDELLRQTRDAYAGLAKAKRTQIRDLNGLIELGAVKIDQREGVLTIRLNLDWPAWITETEFAERVERLPKAKTHPYLRG